MKRLIIAFIIVVVSAGPGFAKDLYRAYVKSRADAENLRSANATPVFRLNDGYLVLLTSDDFIELSRSNVQLNLIEEEIRIDQIAVERNRGLSPDKRFPLLFTIDNLRFYRVDAPRGLGERSDLTILRQSIPEITYTPPSRASSFTGIGDIDFADLIDDISQDSVEAYLLRLEAFYRRLTGTDSCYAARDWILGKFQDFGYGSAYVQPFTGSQLWDYTLVQSYNVIATKTGTRFPNREVIIGGHFDAVPSCPGADDNGSGTTGVLELARVMANIETDLTFKFIAFDSEESWMWGSYYYADQARAQGDSIVYMCNLDMIGHHTNSNAANLYYGPVDAYARLWQSLSFPLVGITGFLSGQTASDHLPFSDNGYDVTFVQEYFFSDHYHMPSDSTSYINFDYMTRMIQATLATVYVIDKSPLPVSLVEVRDVGDGQSLLVEWDPMDPAEISTFTVYYYPTSQPSQVNSLTVPGNHTSTTISGLQLGDEYTVFVEAENSDGFKSIVLHEMTGTPYRYPRLPADLAAIPRYKGIELVWQRNNRELDFSHYEIIRDGVLLPGVTADTMFVDYDPALGSDFHDYHVIAMDTEGFMSDTLGTLPVSCRAATLEQGRILAVNRASVLSSAMVEPESTRTYLEEALTGYNYDYFDDTRAKSGGGDDTLNLFDMIDYGIIVFGAESGRMDDLGGQPQFGGILDTLAVYMGMGGKVITFGRWGDLTVQQTGRVDQITYPEGHDDHEYYSLFDIAMRYMSFSFLDRYTGIVYSDMHGAESQEAGYPNLAWDSLRAVDHEPSYEDITGTPCPSAVSLLSGPDVLYRYVSESLPSEMDGRVVAWRRPGKYVFFEIPLSFMERSNAVTALQKAIADMGTANVFIELDRYNIEFATTDTATVMPPPEMVSISCPAGDGMLSWQLVDNCSWLTVDKVSGSNPDQVEISLMPGPHPMGTRSTMLPIVDPEALNSPVYIQVSLVVQGEGCCTLAGDVNGDLSFNVTDAVFVVNHVFKGGPAPECAEAADVNADCNFNITDGVYIVNHIFRGGPAPTCSPCESQVL